jgi:sigma-E factor negative regulatory protein RseC
MPDQHMIDHEGIVEYMRGDVVHVKIISESACAACQAKGVCGAADREEKYLDIPAEKEHYEPGEPVRVLISKNLGLKAVALGYFYPFLLLMAVLTGLIVAGVSELRAGIIALCTLAPYYLALFLLKKRIGGIFTFKLKKINTG